MRQMLLAASLALSLTGCTSAKPIKLAQPFVPAHDVLQQPTNTRNGQLQYNDDGSETFAPVLSGQAYYPTQTQAQYAFLRKANKHLHGATSIHIFACKQGALNGQTGRVEDFAGKHLAHCASDLLNSKNQKLARIPLDFYYDKGRWNLYEPDPTYKAVIWADPEKSPPVKRQW